MGGEETVKAVVSQEESETPGEDESQGENDLSKEKSPEKMTKAELLQKVRELQEKSEKNYDLYLRSQAENDNIIKRNKKERGADSRPSPGRAVTAAS